jgi:hypothetical protein
MDAERAGMSMRANRNGREVIALNDVMRFVRCAGIADHAADHLHDRDVFFLGTSERFGILRPH